MLFGIQNSHRLMCDTGERISFPEPGHGDWRMKERFYLVKAQAADAVANAAVSTDVRSYWEGVADKYRELARVSALMRRGEVPTEF